jgi:hypothetical protein
MATYLPAILGIVFCGTLFPTSSGVTRCEASIFYPALYYPASSDTSGASRIHLDPGAVFPHVLLAPRAVGGSIGLRVLDDGDGSPVAGVLVEASVGRFHAHARSGADGLAVVTGVTPGLARVAVRPDDPRSETGAYAVSTVASPFEVLDGERSDAGEIRLLRAGRIKARIWNPDGPVWAGIPVILKSADGSMRRIVRTADDGRASFGGLSPGSYLLWADTRGTHAVLEAWDGSRDTVASTPLEVERGALLSPIEIRPDRGGVLSGAVRDERTSSGIPVIEVQVTAQRPPGTTYTFRTDSLGFYLADGLPGGSYKIYVPALLRWYPDAASESAARAVTATEGDTVYGIDLAGDPMAACTVASRLPSGITGTILADFDIMPGAAIVAWNDADTIQQVVRKAGSYTLTCVPPGSYRIRCTPEGAYRTQFYRRTYTPDSAIVVTVAAGDTARGVDFELQRSVVIEGIVEDGESGVALEGIRVVGARSGRDRVEALSDAAGAFRLDRLPDGSGLPAGDWIVGIDSLVVEEIAPTPIRAIELAAARAGPFVRLLFRVPEDLAIGDWFLERRCGDADAAVIADASRHPQGTRAREFTDPETGGECAYRLMIDLAAEGAGGRIASEWASAGAAPRLPFPSPWDGRNILRLPEPAAPDVPCLLLSPDGSRVVELRAQGLELSPPAGPPIASGVYFLRWRGASGATRTSRIVVKR